MRHFRLEELVDKETFKQRGEEAWQLFTSDALIMLDDLREFFNTPITVNNWHSGGPFQFRGYRPPTYKPGVTPGSYHRKGMAFDCDVAGHTAFECRKMIVAAAKVDNPLVAKINRVEGDVNWLHIDCGKVPNGRRIYVFQA